MQAIDTLIRKLRATTTLDADDIAELRSLPVQLRELDERTAIVREGDRPSQCCLLVQGFLCRAKVAENGRRQIMSFHIAGDVPDLQSLFLKVMDHDLSTISAATVAFINHRDLYRIIDTKPAIARALWRDTLVDAAVFREWIVNVGVRPAGARMAHLLAELRERMAAVGLVAQDEFAFPVTQSELAEALGITAVHVNRVIQTFRANGLLDMRNKTVTLRDVEKICEVGGFNDLYLHQAPSM